MYTFIYLFMIPSTMHITSFYHQSTYTYFLDHHNGTNSKLTNMNFSFLMFNLPYFYVIYDIYNGAVCSSTLHQLEWQGNKQNVMDVAGSNPVQILGTTLAFAWKNWRKPRKRSELSVCKPITEHGTSITQNRSVSHSTVTFRSPLT